MYHMHVLKIEEKFATHVLNSTNVDFILIKNKKIK